MDATIAVLPAPTSLVARVGLLATGIVGNGVATGLYIGAGLGSGPRDGLMMGLAARGYSLAVRTLLEVAVLAVGWAVGGTVGVGTLAYALGIGPLVQRLLPALTLPAAEREPSDPRPRALRRRSRCCPASLVTPPMDPNSMEGKKKRDDPPPVRARRVDVDISPSTSPASTPSAAGPVADAHERSAWASTSCPPRTTPAGNHPPMRPGPCSPGWRPAPRIAVASRVLGCRTGRRRWSPRWPRRSTGCPAGG